MCLINKALARACRESKFNFPARALFFALYCYFYNTYTDAEISGLRHRVYFGAEWNSRALCALAWCGEREKKARAARVVGKKKRKYKQAVVYLNLTKAGGIIQERRFYSVRQARGRVWNCIFATLRFSTSVYMMHHMYTWEASIMDVALNWLYIYITRLL